MHNRERRTLDFLRRAENKIFPGRRGVRGASSTSHSFVDAQAFMPRQLELREAVPRVAAIVSIVEACRRCNIPVRDYLGSVLPGLANCSINRIAEFTPSAWAA